MIEGKLGRRRGEFGGERARRLVSDNGGEEEEEDEILPDRLVSSLGLGLWLTRDRGRP
jgi:hypothetical protein